MDGYGSIGIDEAHHLLEEMLRDHSLNFTVRDIATSACAMMRDLQKDQPIPWDSLRTLLKDLTRVMCEVRMEEKQIKILEQFSREIVQQTEEEPYEGPVM